MKINSFITLICVIISALLAYGLYTWSSAENKLLISSGGFISFFITLSAAMAIDLGSSRTNTNIRALSFTFLLLAILAHIILAFYQVSNPLYIVSIGVVLCVYLLVSYGIKKAGQ